MNWLQAVVGRLAAGVLVMAATILVPVSTAQAAQPTCGATILVDTVLTSDLVCPGNGLHLGADNITLDLNGRTISGPGPNVRPGPNQIFAGVRVLQNVTGVTVKNGTVRQFTIGLTTQVGSNGGHFTSLNLINNGQAILTQFLVQTGATSDHNMFRNNTVEQSTGINGPAVLFFGTGNRFEVNSVRNNFTNGVEVRGSQTIVSGNMVVNNRGNAIYIGRPTSAGIFRNNRIEANTVTGNQVPNQNSPSVFAWASDGTIIRNNRVVGVGTASGISLFGPDNSNAAISGNHVSNYRDGIFIEPGSRAVLVSGNNASHNVDDGIEVQSASTTLTKNLVAYNGDRGIEAPFGAIDGGGNRAVGNGNPQPCSPPIACV